MLSLRRLPARLSLAAVIAVAACTTPPPPPPPTPPPPVVPTIMPTPPDGAAPDMDLPDKAADGTYLTPNRGMQGQQALWHVRMALNVAALSCHGQGEQALIQYNRMLKIHVIPLKQANDAIEALYQGRYTSNFLEARERLNTTVYNFFALPPVQPAFCAQSVAVLTIINGMTAQQLLAYAPQALHDLEKPFQDFYEAYADYLRRLEEWRRRFGATVTLLGPDPNQSEPAPPPPPEAPLPDLPLNIPSTPPVAPSQTITPPQ
ncbi:hypothetical protein [Sphingobium ummariense]